MATFYTSYSIMPDRRTMLVRPVEGGYAALLVGADLKEVDRRELGPLRSVYDATKAALEAFGIRSQVNTIVFRETPSLAERTETKSYEVEDELIRNLRTVSSSSLLTLMNDPSLPEATRAAMYYVLKERREDTPKEGDAR